MSRMYIRRADQEHVRMTLTRKLYMEGYEADTAERRMLLERMMHGDRLSLPVSRSDQ